MHKRIVIGLISTLMILILSALVLIPSAKGFLRDTEISQSNQNANIVYSAAKCALDKYKNENEISSLESVVTNVYQYSNCDTVAIGNSCVLNIKDYLGENFEGYFAFAITENGDDIEYAIWSKEKIEEISPQTSQEQERDYASDKVVIGCYPI